NLYSDLATGYVFDEVDRDQLGAIEALGLRAIATQTLMKDIEISTALAASAMRLALELR
ncbi:MAG: 2-phospho-L-lactate transferase, partial [bacterium]|nr:2-phospho-L-lactate transferase [bacterium]